MLAKQGDPAEWVKPTRILIIHTKYAECGGESSVVQNEIALLKEHGCDIIEMYFDNTRLTALNVLLMPFNILSFFRVLIVCVKYKPALVHIHNMHFAASPAIIWAIKLLKIPIVKTLHNYRLLCPSGMLFFRGKLYLKSLQGAFPWKAVKEKIYRNSFFLTFWLAFSTWIHRKSTTWKLIDKYIVLSEQSRQLFLDANLGLLDTQVVVKPNFTREKLKLPFQRSNNFLYIGRLSEEKGIKILLEAFASNGLPLTIIGDGPCSTEVLTAIKKNPLIDWRGYQGSEVISAELQKCAALIFPSICYEGMPVTIIEAFACNTPVIASKLGAMEKMVQHNYNGLFFEAGDKGDLNAQLIYWNNLTEPGKKNFYRNAGKSYEEKYTPEKNFELLLSIYNSVAFNSYPVSKRFAAVKFKAAL